MFQKLFQKKKETNNNPETVIGIGIDLQAKEKKLTNIVLPDSARKGQFWCFGTNRVGKAQSLDSLVHTPDGWKRMGDIKKGYTVSTPDNKTATVIDVFPQGVLPLYKITLYDGRTAEASNEHLWEIHIGYSKKKKKTIVTTAMLRRIMQNKKVFIQVYNPSKKCEKIKLVAVKSIEFNRNAEAQCILLDSENHLYITDNYIVTHNTRVMENMIEQDIKKGYSVVVIDPKGDIELFNKIIQVSAMAKRLDDISFITPIFPEYSAVINPLSSYYMPEEIVGHIVSGVETGKEPYFFNVAYEISLVLVQSLELIAHSQGKEPDFNLLKIKNYISREELEKLKAQELDKLTQRNIEYAYQYSMDLQKILDSPQDYYSKVSSSLRVALTELTSGNIGKIIGQADENRFIKRLQEGKPVILIAHLGSLLTRKAASTLGKVLISMIQSFIGRVFSSGRVLNPPLCIYIDEAQSTLYPGIDDLFAKAGGAGVWIHGFCQSVNQMYAAIGQDYTKTILDNTNSKFFMRVPDYDTAHYISGQFGTVRKFSPILSVGGGISTREEELPLVREEDILRLQPRQFYFTSYHGTFKGKTKDTSELFVNVEFPSVHFTDNKEKEEAA